MASVIEEAVARLAARLDEGATLPGVAKFVLEGEGEILVDGSGVRAGAGEGDAEVTLTASVEVFRAMLEGGLSPMSAYMSGKLKIEGRMGLAMQLGSLLG